MLIAVSSDLSSTTAKRCYPCRLMSAKALMIKGSVCGPSKRSLHISI